MRSGTVLAATLLVGPLVACTANEPRGRLVYVLTSPFFPSQIVNSFRYEDGPVLGGESCVQSIDLVELELLSAALRDGERIPDQNLPLEDAYVFAFSDEHGRYGFVTGDNVSQLPDGGNFQLDDESSDAAAELAERIQMQGICREVWR